MGYIRKRRFHARYRRPAGKKGKKRRLALAAAGVLLFWGILAETGLSSVSQKLTEEAAREYLLSAINAAVNAELEERESSFVTVTKSSGGEVSSIRTDAMALNHLKAGVVSRLTKSLNGRITARIPAGSLTDVAVFNGRGPSVPVKLNLKGSADVSFQTKFTSAGVNQSCHQIVMTVKAGAYSQSKRFEVWAQEESSTVLAETVVIGQVPQVALAGSS